MRTGTVASTDNRNWELLPDNTPQRRFSQSRAVALDMESATIAANGFRFRVPYGTLLCVSDKPLHGEIKLPGMANHFYRERVDQHLRIGIRAVELLRERPCGPVAQPQAAQLCRSGFSVISDPEQDQTCMQSIREFFIQTFGIEAWLAMLVAIVRAGAAVEPGFPGGRTTSSTNWPSAPNTAWDESLITRSAGAPPTCSSASSRWRWMARVLHAQWPEFDVARRGLAGAQRGHRAGRGLVLSGSSSSCSPAAPSTGAREGGQDFDVTTVFALSKLSRLVIFVVTVITVAHTLGFNVGALLALGGVGGIAVGLAAKDLLANFFGGLTIYLDRPFSVGDWIRSPDKSIEGTVEYISWRHTRIRAFNKNPIYVPNAVFTTIVVENPSRMSHRRLKETVGAALRRFCAGRSHRGRHQDHAGEPQRHRHHPDADRQLQRLRAPARWTS